MRNYDAVAFVGLSKRVMQCMKYKKMLNEQDVTRMLRARTQRVNLIVRHSTEVRIPSKRRDYQSVTSIKYYGQK